MDADTLFWQQCTQAVNNDGSVDAKRLMALVIDTYRSHGRNHALFALVLDNLPLGLSVFDSAQRLILCNDRFRQLFGFSADQAVPGDSVRALSTRIPGKERTMVRSAYRSKEASAMPTGQGKIRRREWLMDDGRIIFSVVTVLPDGSNIAIHSDITEERKAAERIAHLAHHDPLTGLPNRIRFREQVDAALSERAPNEQIALVHLNLDRFKSINDTMGVSTGDTILRQVAERIRASASSENMLARLGSDEFAILQRGRQQPWNVTALADQIRRELSEPFFRGDKQIELSVSMGIALAPEDGAETDVLLRNAGVALSQAKADGRKHERFFTSEMACRIQARHALEADLRLASQGDEFELHYQPLYDLRQQRICGFEALVRWNHPTRGRVPPMEFIPLAEEVGLVVDIGRWVLTKACREAACWPQDIKIAVNVSAIQFTSSNLLADVDEAIAQAAISPARLELEITESVLMENLDDTLPILHALKERGIRISMDDFGTGYSSLSYLSSFPFDKIKIDKSFVCGIAENKEAYAIMHAIILLGDALGMRVTVEGVETAEQKSLLERKECDEIQGYYISPPVPASDVARLLSASRSGSMAKAS